MTAENTGGREACINSAEGEEGVSVAASPSGAWLEDLLARRLVFVMGKGGVGKTTISIALANAASRLKKKVLLVELGDTDSIGSIYDRTLSETPARLAPGIWGTRVDAKVELEAYVRAHIPSKFIAGKIARSRLLDYLFEAAPGLKEVMSLGRLWRWEQEAPRLPNASFDLIIVDSPATGHALSLLRLPDLLIKMIRVGPVANQLRAVQHLLKNHQKTAIALVTLPEELPVNETVELYQTANESLDMPVAAIFINSVFPDFFNRQDTQQIHSLKIYFQNRTSAPESEILACATNLIRRQGFQKKQIRKICAKTKCHVQKMPYFFTNDMTLKEIEKLSLEIGHNASTPPGKSILTAISDAIRDPAGPEIIICCGSGGVGKTTISAAVGLCAAMNGKKTIVLTIDPARRLADALGMKRFATEIQRVPLENLNIAKNRVKPMGELSAMMLDPKSTFDQIVARYASPEFQKNIFKNRYYQHLSRNMAGSHEYMAMEKLYEIFHQGDYDLIVLDTPPSRRALDFLEAPQKMLNILGHNFFMKMFKPYLKAGKWGVRLLNIFASPVLKAISKVVGKQALEDFSGFMQLWDDVMFEGFSRRAASVKALLAGRQTLFLAVATPQRLPVKEAFFLSEKLRLNGMPFGGFIINRVHSFNSHPDSRSIDLNTVFKETPVDPALKETLLTVYQNMRKLAQSDARSIDQLIEKVGSNVDVVSVPLSDREIVSLDDLYRLARLLE